MSKKKVHPILKILVVLIIVFAALFIANMSGYYESKIRDRVLITEEGIKEFEEKIQNGEEIDITNFLKNEREDYNSKMSNLGERVTEGLGEFMSSGLGIVKDIVNSLF